MEPQIELTAEGLWSEVSGRLRGALNETTYRTWFDHVEGLELSENEFVLAVPNDFTRDWIEGHFVGLISAAVGDATGHERRIGLAVTEVEGEQTEPVEVHRRETAVAGLNPHASEGGMFGQDLISEKSLDEVILAYLSEDGSED